MHEVVTKKKYKPIAKKVWPVIAELPEKFQIVQNIKGDLLVDMPSLNSNLPAFQPTECYTQECHNTLDKKHPDFLLSKECDLIHNFMCQQNQAFAWNNGECGHFKSEYFPPINILIVPHVLFIEKNIPILPGIYHKVCAIIRKKLAASVYESSNSASHSRWFCVLKKDGALLRIVHSLKPLNKITIKHSGIPPIPDHLAEQFTG